jgi:hypothetical protein
MASKYKTFLFGADNPFGLTWYGPFLGTTLFSSSILILYYLVCCPYPFDSFIFILPIPTLGPLTLFLPLYYLCTNSKASLLGCSSWIALHGLSSVLLSFISAWSNTLSWSSLNFYCDSLLYTPKLWETFKSFLGIYLLGSSSMIRLDSRFYFYDEAAWTSLSTVSASSSISYLLIRLGVFSD